MPNYSETKTPSGKKAIDYSHINLRLWFPDLSMDPWTNDIDAAATPNPAPGWDLFRVMAEQLAASAAMASDMGYEHTLEELSRNAKIIGRTESRPMPNWDNATRTVGPSGETFPAYGAVDVYGWLDKDEEGEIAIHTDPKKAPQEILLAAAVRMISAAAWQSPEAGAFGERGFDAAVDLIIDGAMEAKGKRRG